MNSKNATQPSINSVPSIDTINTILIINAGTSTIKFALYQPRELKLVFEGKIERVGQEDSRLICKYTAINSLEALPLVITDRKSTINFLIHWLEQQACFGTIKAVAHRVVHGMHHTAPERVSKSLLVELHQIGANDRDHLPGEVEIIEAIFWRHPMLTQVVCFDAAFHHSLPRVAKLLAIPRRFSNKGIERYGFYGFSYAYLLFELERIGEPSACKGRVILAHLGSGVSIAAILDGKSIDTSMCFTQASGLPMATRSGDLDPGLISYLMQNEKMTSTQLRHIVNYESGLLGVSETTSDMRDLLVLEKTDVRAAEAIEMFCYQVKKWLGAYAAALGGIDTLVFTGGIGEYAASVRTRICEGLEFLGIKLDEVKNTSNMQVISSVTTRVKIFVIHTNEELMIARCALQILPTRRASSRVLNQEK